MNATIYVMLDRSAALESYDAEYLQIAPCTGRYLAHDDVNGCSGDKPRTESLLCMHKLIVYVHS